MLRKEDSVKLVCVYRQKKRKLVGVQALENASPKRASVLVEQKKHYVISRKLVQDLL